MIERPALNLKFVKRPVFALATDVMRTFISFGQLPNTTVPVVVTLETGNVIDVNSEQYRNAPSPMVVSEFGITTDVNAEHESKELAPMLVKVFGNVIDANLEHSWNALAPMVITEVDIVTDVNALQL